LFLVKTNEKEEEKRKNKEDLPVFSSTDFSPYSSTRMHTDLIMVTG